MTLITFVASQAREPDPIATMVRELEAAIEADEVKRVRYAAVRRWRLDKARAERDRLIAERDDLLSRRAA